MTIYKLAVRYTQMMAVAMLVTIFFVITFERIFGFTAPAFAISIVVLVVANAKMLELNCPDCGTNLFMRGWVAMPWPSRVCSKCQRDLNS